jgi:hypothetical protein
MRIPVTLVIEFDDEQEVAYADAYGVGNLVDGKWKYSAKDMVGSVRAYVLAELQESAAFGMDPVGARGATIKER